MCGETKFLWSSGLPRSGTSSTEWKCPEGTVWRRGGLESASAKEGAGVPGRGNSGRGLALSPSPRPQEEVLS